MCYIFRQIFPFHSELRKDKIATSLLLSPAVFLSPPTFWEARDQPEPGSFFPRMKDPGNEVGKFMEISMYKAGTNLPIIFYFYHATGNSMENSMYKARENLLIII